MIRIPTPVELQLIGVRLPTEADLGELAWLVGAISGAVLFVGCMGLAWLVGLALSELIEWIVDRVARWSERVQRAESESFRQVSSCACPNPPGHEPWCDAILVGVRGRL